MPNLFVCSQRKKNTLPDAKYMIISGEQYMYSECTCHAEYKNDQPNHSSMQAWVMLIADDGIVL